jgi:hypothetical protein
MFPDSEVLSRVQCWQQSLACLGKTRSFFSENILFVGRSPKTWANERLSLFAGLAGVLDPAVFPSETAVKATLLTDEPVAEEEERPTSPEKLAANRANARRSTGPKTPEGKEKSKFNAVEHGLTSRYFPAVIEAGTAEWDELEAVRTDLLSHCQPVGPIEELLLEKITIEYMRYRRLVEREQVSSAFTTADIILRLWTN